MSRSVRTISVNFSAGTVKFFTDVDAAGAKIRSFGGQTEGDFRRIGREAGAAGSAVQEAGGRMISEARATTAGMKALEGQFFNNKKAADKFLETILGGGPIMQAAFPIVGAVAFGGMLVKMGTELHEFYKGVQEGPQKMAEAFRALNAPLRLTNDELAVTNARLEQDIAKLEGHRQNTLKTALYEARVEADKLADSLDNDLKKMYELMKQENLGAFKAFFTGQQSTSGDTEGVKKFAERMLEINAEGNMAVHLAKTKEEAAQKQDEWNEKLTKGLDEQIAKTKKQIEESEKLQKLHLHNPRVFDPQQHVWVQPFSVADQSVVLREQRDTLENLNYLRSRVALTAENTTLTQRKGADQAANANAGLDRPFQDRMKAMAAQIEGLQAKLKAIGAPDAEQQLAKTFAEAQKIITEVNKALEHHHTQLNEAQKDQIRVAERTIVATEAEEQWRTKMASATTAIADRIKAQQLLTAAIGKGYEAARAANVETRLMQELGQHASDPAWMKLHQADIAGLRAGFAGEFDAQHAERSAAAVHKLTDQIELERLLASVQRDGAEAVRRAGLELSLQRMAEDGATKAEIAAERELYEVRRVNEDAGAVAKIEERTAAILRLTVAILGGAEAERRAALENKYAEIRRGGDTAIPGVIGMGEKELAARREDEAAHQQTITAEAMKLALAFQNQLEHIDQLIAKLKEIRAAEGDSLGIQIAMRGLENERLKALASESLQMRGARDGVRAFFIEMQADAKSSAEIVYESLHSALDRVSSNLAKLFTGQKTNWASAFKDLGEQMVQSTTKSMLQKGLGLLGQKFGIDVSVGKPDGSASNPLHVKVVNGMPGVGGIPGVGGKGGGVFGGGSQGGGIFSFLANLFKGGGGGGGIGSMDLAPAGMDAFSGLDFGGWMAGGGDVEPGRAYRVGEKHEEWFVPGMRGSIVPNLSTGGGDVHNHYHIDARGADLGAQNRIQRGIEASHKLAVVTAVQANQERSRRV